MNESAISNKLHMTSLVADAIQEIIVEDGHSSTEALIERARPESSPIHCAFEWDDQVAGEEYRRQQSRAWHRRVLVNVQKDEDGEPIMVTLVHVPNKNGNDRSGWYVPVTAVRDDEESFQLALRYALNMARANFRVVRELLDAAGDDKDRQRVAREVERGSQIIGRALELVK